MPSFARIKGRDPLYPVFFDVSLKKLLEFRVFGDVFGWRWKMGLKMAENLIERQDEWDSEPVKLQHYKIGYRLVRRSYTVAANQRYQQLLYKCIETSIRNNILSVN